MSDFKGIIGDLSLLVTTVVLPIIAYTQHRRNKQSAKEEARDALTWAVDQGIAYAEEWSRQNPQAHGVDKLSKACWMARDLAPLHTHKFNDAELTNLVMGRLALLRPSFRPPK